MDHKQFRAKYAHVFGDLFGPMQIALILDRSGLRKSEVPFITAGMAPHEYWNDVLMRLEDGLIVDGMEAVTLAALKLRPANQDLAEAMRMIKGDGKLPPRAVVALTNPNSGSCADPEIFFSYASPERDKVLQIATSLSQKGKRVWLDCWCITPGQNFIDSLDRVLDTCPRFAICLGPSGINPWHRLEAYSALQKYVKDNSKRVIPVLLPGALRDAMPVFLRQFSDVAFTSVADTKALDLLASF